MHKLGSFIRTSSLALALAAASASAHHPIMGKFDEASTVEFTGVVTYVDWRNPHTHVFMNVETQNGVENWAIELESPVLLRQSGWDSDTLIPGDEIRVEGMRARDGTRQAWGDSVVLTRNGHEVYALAEANPKEPLAPRPTPRWPDGKPALGAVPGSVDGFWSFPTKTSLVEDGVEVAVDKYGKLEDLSDASEVAPLQPWALALYQYRQERDLRDDPLFLNCKPPGGPRQYQSQLGIQLVEDKREERVFVLMGSGNRNFRIIYLDDRDPTGQVGGDDDNPLYYGRSVGEWQGDTLVVNTTGFNEDFWFSNGGLPHTSLLQMEERFSRPDFDTLHYEVTINDPGAYTRAWTASWDLKWMGGAELPFHLCQHNRP